MILPEKRKKVSYFYYDIEGKRTKKGPSPFAALLPNKANFLLFFFE